MTEATAAYGKALESLVGLSRHGKLGHQEWSGGDMSSKRPQWLALARIQGSL